MANALKMAIVQSIQQLHAAGWSQRRIARELEIDRGTVARHLRPRPPDPKPAIPPAGFSPAGDSNAATFSPVPAPGSSTSAGSGDADHAAAPNAAILPAGSEGGNHAATTPANVRSSLGRPTQCEPFRELILAQLDQRLSAQRIWQDLVTEHGFTGGYDSVKRFVRRLGAATPLPFRRMECAPGEEAQVDFGTGAPVIGADGKRRKTHVFRIVLSHSRKGYSEATFTQTTDDFLQALENAFAHFGGVPQTLVIDNLKAAVAHPDWFDPVLTPKIQSFCRHYGTVILPTKPRMPRHKGKVEAGVKYVQSNGLKGRKFASLQEQQQHLAHWERTVADTRIHGTTKQQVLQVFEEVERPALRVLRQERFPNFREAKRKVNRDGHVEVAKAYYSVPPEYLGREVWARWDARLVRIFNGRWEQIAVHVRHEQGRFSTHGQHLVKEKISGLERGASYLLDKVSALGEQTHQWAKAMLTARGIEGTRVLQGLLSLAKKHTSQTMEKACETALSHGCFRLRTIRQLLQRESAKQEPLGFLDEHPLIRPLDDYGQIVARAIHRQADRSSVSEGFQRHDRTKTKSLTTVSQPGSSPKTADLFPPGSGYPSSGCTSAEPGSVSPDNSIVVTPSSVPPSSLNQEQSDE
jgi:transposase